MEGTVLSTQWPFIKGSLWHRVLWMVRSLGQGQITNPLSTKAGPAGHLRESLVPACLSGPGGGRQEDPPVLLHVFVTHSLWLRAAGQVQDRTGPGLPLSGSGSHGPVVYSLGLIDISTSVKWG